MKQSKHTLLSYLDIDLDTPNLSHTLIIPTLLTINFSKLYSGEYVTYWFGRENLALGKIRMRQLRVEDEACDVAEAFQDKLGKYCYPAVVPGPLQTSSNYRGKTNGSSTFVTPYESNGDGYSWYSGTSKIMYPSSGYMVELPLTETAATAVLTELQEQDWVDENTRAVFIEFSTYNANIDHFSVGRSVSLTFSPILSHFVINFGNY